MHHYEAGEIYLPAHEEGFGSLPVDTYLVFKRTNIVLESDTKRIRVSVAAGFSHHAVTTALFQSAKIVNGRGEALESLVRQIKRAKSAGFPTARSYVLCQVRDELSNDFLRMTAHFDPENPCAYTLAPLWTEPLDRIIERDEELGRRLDAQCAYAIHQFKNEFPSANMA